MNVIEITDLRKRYGTRTAVHDVGLQVRPGTIHGLIGPNGAGKTTTLRTLVDIIRPTSGTVRVLGEDPRTGGARLRRRIGYVPGELRLEGRVTGQRMLSFYAQVSGPVAAGRAGELAERLGVDLSRPVRSLSKGNKQKLGLIQAFMHRPELLILDEPTSGLDPLVQREFLAMVREARDAGQTVLLSSHVLSEIQQTADEVSVLSAGRVVAQGDVASLRLGAVRRVRAALGEADAELVRRRFEALPGVEGLELTTDEGIVQLSATVEGAIDPLVKTLAEFPVRDLTIEEPDLEESVLRLYGAPSSSSSLFFFADTPPCRRDPRAPAPAARGVGENTGCRRGGRRGGRCPMNGPVLLRSIRESWRGVVGWSIGIAGVLLLYLPLYPSFGANGQLDDVIKALPQSLIETLGYDQIATGAGYAQSTFYGLTGFLLITIAAVLWASAAIAGAEESGRLELDLAHGIGRVPYAVTVALAVLVRLLWLGVFSGVIVLALNGPAQLGIHPPHILAATLSLTGLAFLCASAGLLAGALTGRRAWASGVAAAVAVLGYVFQAVAKQSADLEWLNALSPYAWVFEHRPLQNGADIGGLLLTWGAAVALAAASALALSRRDLRG